MSTQSIASDNYFYSVQTNKRILGKYTAVRMIAILHENQLVSGKESSDRSGVFFFLFCFFFGLLFFGENSEKERNSNCWKKEKDSLIYVSHS